MPDRGVSNIKALLAVLIVAVLVGSAVIVYLHNADNTDRGDGTGDSYNWIYQGVEFRLGLNLNYNLLAYYDPDNVERVPDSNSDSRGSNIIDYVMADADNLDVIKQLSESLIRLYHDAYGTDTLGQGYLDFVLSFIRSNFNYELDFFMYGMPDYMALPIETLLKGAGDLEDLSVLYATLLYASGYDVGIIVYKNHAMASVKLDSFEISNNGYHLSCMEHNSEKYYGCETTPDAYCPVGYADHDLIGDIDTAILYANE
jgi:hypothetical protein